MRRILYIPFIILVTATSLHCGTDEVRFINVSPSVTSIGPIEVTDDGIFKTYLSVADLESDPVDIAIQWEDNAGNSGPVTFIPGQGHGSVGLASSPEGAGVLHVVFWQADFDGAETVRILITPEDLIAPAGLTALSPQFPVSTGYDEIHYP